MHLAMQTRPESPIAVNAAEAAALVGMSERTFRQLVRQKRIPHVRLDGRIVFPVQALTEWFNARALEAVVPEPAPVPLPDDAPRRGARRPRRAHA